MNQLLNFQIFSLTISLLFGFNSFAQNHNPLRGFVRTDRIIQERMLREGESLAFYLGKNDDTPSSGNLLGLLGTYSGSGTDGEFQNGNPNSVNMLLWYVVLDKLSQEASLLCADIKIKHRFRLEFVQTMQPLCAWPALSSRNDATLYQFWITLVGFDVPTEEFQIWKSYFQTDPENQNLTGAQVVAQMILSALYNPYFLLQD